MTIFYCLTNLRVVKLPPVMSPWQTVKLLLVLASTVILGSEIRETHDHILLSHESESCETPPGDESLADSEIAAGPRQHSYTWFRNPRDS
jgi:hypothetical protein